jgi:hypothetical protein
MSKPNLHDDMTYPELIDSLTLPIFPSMDFKTRELLWRVKYSHRLSPRDYAEFERLRINDGRVKEGLPALPPVDKQAANRERTRRNQGAWRERERAKRGIPPKIRPAIAADDLCDLSLERFRRDEVCLAAWAKTPGPAQRALNRTDRLKSVHRSWILLLGFRAKEGRDPTDSQFATILTAKLGGDWTRQIAYRRLSLLRRLEQPGGPWEPASI